MWLIFLLLGGCGSLDFSTKGGLPSWAIDVSKECSPTADFCAAGEGNSLEHADLMARKGIAQIFETRIESHVASLVEERSGKDDGVDPTVSEFNQSEIKESTDQILNGVEIIQRAQENRQGQVVYFALARFDKRKKAQELAQRIGDWDQKIKALFAENKRSSFFRLLQLNSLRQSLNDRYHFLSGEFLPPIVSLADIEKRKNWLDQNREKISLHIEDQTKGEELKKFLNKLFLDQFFDLVSQTGDGNFQVYGKIDMSKGHLNVPGFEKYHYHVYLESKKLDNAKLGAVSFNLEKTGRSMEDSYQKALPEIKIFLEENIYELNLP